MESPESVLYEYRNNLTELEQKSQESYDKAVLALSGGALGLSFTFTKDIIDLTTATGTTWLLVAWFLWGLSSTAVLFSYYFSQLALREAVKQVDLILVSYQENPNHQITQDDLGRPHDGITSFLNAFGGILFLLGLMSIVSFVATNL